MLSPNQMKHKKNMMDYFKIGTKLNIVKFNTHNDIKHEMRKALISLVLQKKGWDVITEGEFNNGSRCDLFVIQTSMIIEVLHSETYEECNQKVQNYPKEFKVVMISTDEPLDINKIS